jgi:hypothetical protein
MSKFHDNSSVCLNVTRDTQNEKIVQQNYNKTFLTVIFYADLVHESGNVGGTFNGPKVVNIDYFGLAIVSTTD